LGHCTIALPRNVLCPRHAPCSKGEGRIGSLHHRVTAQCVVSTPCPMLKGRGAHWVIAPSRCRAMCCVHAMPHAQRERGALGHRTIALPRNVLCPRHAPCSKGEGRIGSSHHRVTAQCVVSTPCPMLKGRGAHWVIAPSRYRAMCCVHAMPKHATPIKPKTPIHAHGGVGG
jgi:hypothetical protein